jgi:hypothetical protein
MIEIDGTPCRLEILDTAGTVWSVNLLAPVLRHFPFSFFPYFFQGSFYCAQTALL